MACMLQRNITSEFDFISISFRFHSIFFTSFIYLMKVLYVYNLPPVEVEEVEEVEEEVEEEEEEEK
jgi:hypothetical protein